MRVAFLGTPAFAVPTLDALVGAGHELACVYTQPPRPSGRGHRPVPGPVARRAGALGLELRHPARLRREPGAWQAFKDLELDVAVVAAYGLILPPAMLEAPRLGCLNVHASLLPRWRGAAPIQAAILAGDATTGVTIMQMDSGLDTGAMLLSGEVAIGRRTSADLLDELAELGARLLIETLETRPTPVAQDDRLATLAPKLAREDAAIDWERDAAAIDRQVRALTPWPGTVTGWAGQQLKVIATEPAVPVPGTVPGTVLDGRLAISCGPDPEGRPTALRIRRLQLAGGPALEADAFLRGRPVPPGTRLGTSV